MSNPLTLAVVGHTNVGKTSLLRTLTRDVHFGEVSSRPSTTIDVQGARLSVDGQALIELYDTPGMEDAIDLLAYLERLQSAERLDGPAQIERFLRTSEARQRYEQEAKVLRRLLSADAGLYVIDAREPVLAKYKDELQILSLCGRALLPVLNFAAHPAANAQAWRETLSRLGLHALVRFDTITPPEDGEQRLYESLALLIEPARGTLEQLLNDHAAKRRQRRQTSAQLIAELLIDVAAYRVYVASDSKQSAAALEALHETVRQREQRCVEALLKLHAFGQDDAYAGDLPLLDGRWDQDLFNPEALKNVGIRLGGGIAAGAAAGAGIDLMVGGITLGAAALLGAIAGGGAQTARHYGRKLRSTFSGEKALSVDDNILRLLALRQAKLLEALEKRGHAATARVELKTEEQVWQQGPLPDALKKARAYAEWSSLDKARFKPSAPRQKAISALAYTLESA